MANYTLSINGAARAVTAEPDTPLLWVLRDTLDLAGTKFGCGGGFCGACTVHVDGRPRRACQLAVSELGGSRITTIEGLSSDGSHPVQRAWQELDVAQCGYCQAGQVMTAAALLARTPNPSDEEILAAMSGNLCRCGTYMRIRRAVRRAAELRTRGGTPNDERRTTNDGPNAELRTQNAERRRV
jgi:isoquinoline 1-oxidoreductase alpha subunit